MNGGAVSQYLEPVQAVGLPGQSVLAHIGKTPLVGLHRLSANMGVHPGVAVFGKAEWFNAGGSVKARSALAMIEDGERRGLLTPNKTIIDATSGNTGIAMAMIGAVKGYRVKLVLPGNVSLERKGILQVYGAEVVLTDPAAGTDGSIRMVQQLIAESHDRYFQPDQYNNSLNWISHYRTTGVEIWEQTGGAVTHFVAGIGTGGTLMGAGRRLKAYNPKIEVIAVEPGEKEPIDGLKHMASSIKPGIYDPNFPDRTVSVRPDQAHRMARDLARNGGLFVGSSAGAAVWAAMQLARELPSGSIVVVILPDGGEKYLSCMC